MNLQHQQLIESTEKYTRPEFDDLLLNLSDTYYNSPGNKDCVPDDVWDKLVDIYEERFSTKYTRVGAPVGTLEKCKLPRYMGSLSKIKTKDAIELWCKKNTGPYVVTDKIDGVSALTNGTRLYTRGSGTLGKDISHLIPFMKIPKIPTPGYWARGEIVMPCKIFEKKYQDEMSNARSMASGLVNAKHPDAKQVKDLVFISYEYGKSAVCDTTDDASDASDDAQSRQLSILEKLGYTLPFYKKCQEIELEELQELLTRRRKEADYNVDGIVIMDDSKHDHVAGENPKYAMAFKMDLEAKETVVEYVEWNISACGRCKPILHLEEFKGFDTNIRRVTGSNAKWIIDNKIGPGSRVSIVKAGEIIPKVHAVLTPSSSGEPQLPESWKWWEKKDYLLATTSNLEYIKKNHGDDIKIETETRNNQKYYTWHKISTVDITIEKDEEMEIRKIVDFFKGIGAKHVGRASLEKLYHSGLNTLNKIMLAKIKDLNQIEGFQEKSATRFINSVKSAITNVPLAKIAAASGQLGEGIGEKKIQKILDAYPNLLEDKTISQSELIEKIQDIGGFKKMANQIAFNLDKLRKFFEQHPSITLLKPTESTDTSDNTSENTDIVTSDDEPKAKRVKLDNIVDKPILSGKLSGKLVAFSGFRSADLKAQIIKCGGQVSDDVVKKTNILIVKEHKSSAKEKKAEKNGAEVLLQDEFSQRYLV